MVIVIYEVMPCADRSTTIWYDIIRNGTRWYERIWSETDSETTDGQSTGLGTVLELKLHGDLHGNRMVNHDYKWIKLIFWILVSRRTVIVRLDPVSILISAGDWIDIESVTRNISKIILFNINKILKFTHF